MQAQIQQVFDYFTSARGHKWRDVHLLNFCERDLCLMLTSAESKNTCKYVQMSH